MRVRTFVMFQKWWQFYVQYCFKWARNLDYDKLPLKRSVSISGPQNRCYLNIAESLNSINKNINKINLLSTGGSDPFAMFIG